MVGSQVEEEAEAWGSYAVTPDVPAKRFSATALSRGGNTFTSTTTYLRNMVLLISFSMPAFLSRQICLEGRLRYDIGGHESL